MALTAPNKASQTITGIMHTFATLRQVGFVATLRVKHFAYMWLRGFSAPQQSPRLTQKKESLQREIELAADGMIDRLVYELPKGG